MFKKIIILLTIIMCLMLAFCACVADDDTNIQGDGQSVQKDLRLIVPNNWELEEGKSRTVDYVFKEGITNRILTWSVLPSENASVDEWGRVTALKAGYAVVKAETSDGICDYVALNIKATNNSDQQSLNTRVVNFNGAAESLGDNLQKVVTKYSIGDENIPESVATIISSEDYTDYKSVTTVDGAIWEITDYGVLRTYSEATLERDVEQRFMGDRYFYSADTKDGLVLGIISDGGKGIWTIMATGVTHIEMLEMSGTDKASLMSANTEEYVQRHGFVAEAYYQGGDIENGDNWKGNESDNDGLWTSMYAAGELMRYASLKMSATATEAEIAKAKESAYFSTEAVLLLSNLCMRTGTVESYIRYQPNGEYDTNSYGSSTANGRYYSADALKEKGDYSLNIPSVSPAEAFEKMYADYQANSDQVNFYDEDYLAPFCAEYWSNPLENPDTTYEMRTRNIEGYIVRTFSYTDENNPTDGYIHWKFLEDGTAIGVSDKGVTEKGYYLNGENLRGVKVDASGEVPQRLWNDIIDEGYEVEDIVYKSDTSSDELIGHIFLYKIAYDILGSEDPEIKGIISNTMERLAQHITDNGYMMVDATGQPGTWSKFNREFFYNSSQLGGAPLTASVVLSLFKVAYYVTGNVKWENEYRMAALDPAYEYAKLMTQYSEQCYIVMQKYLRGGVELNGTPVNVSQLLKSLKIEADLSYGSDLSNLLIRLFCNYSDEEMAMLAFYTLFQLETDEELLSMYREAMDDWWNSSIKYSENPLWYYIYQLAYPDEEKFDYYGNSLIETAAWSLSRHPIDTRRFLASNANRDDITVMDLNSLVGDGAQISYDISKGNELDLSKESMINGIMKCIQVGPTLNWAVAAPDERALHKYNGNSYRLTTDHNPYCMEGSTTYTLPYWMGIYHGMLKDIE